jgi:multicomponent Na+:H+ antiporter subunit B
MTNHTVLITIARFLIPFLLMYGFYVQLHGEHSAGGGFQAGVIVAAAFILHALIFGLEKTQEVLPLTWLKAMTSIGVLLYGGVGVVAMVLGGKYLDYSQLLSDPVAGQQLGITLIEAGVGITVFSVMLTIYYVFAGRDAAR